MFGQGFLTLASLRLIVNHPFLMLPKALLIVSRSFLTLGMLSQAFLMFRKGF
jgi:hypothetical protein